MSNSIKDSAQAFAVNQVLKYVDSNPQEALYCLYWPYHRSTHRSRRTGIDLLGK